MRALFSIVLALWAATAAGEEFRELAPGAGAVHVQHGELLLLEADGREGPRMKVHAGVFYTLPGHQRLTAAFSQLQADKLAAQARADALQQALTLRAAPPTAKVSTGAVVAVALLLVLSGGIAGYALAR